MEAFVLLYSLAVGACIAYAERNNFATPAILAFAFFSTIYYIYWATKPELAMYYRMLNMSVIPLVIIGYHYSHRLIK